MSVTIGGARVRKASESDRASIEIMVATAAQRADRPGLAASAL
jgi:hypothetical protein